MPLNNAWKSPLPLVQENDTKPYPLDALPSVLKDAIEEVRAFTKAPLSLVASSALATLSIAAQSHADVKRAEKLSGPSGLFLLTIADSGERKSTCESFFMKVIEEYELNQARSAKELITKYKTDSKVWKSKYDGLNDKIRNHTKDDKDTEKHENKLQKLEKNKPKYPRIPRLICLDTTPESLKWKLAKEWPSGGIVSSEAGLFFGSHGMGKDSIVRNLATLNQLWDAKSISTDRRTSESFTVKGARLTISLQIQESAFRNFLNTSGDLARGIGFLSRFLISWPISTQGSRLYSDPPKSWPLLEKFNQGISKILNQNVCISEDEGLKPCSISMSKKGKARWIEFYNKVEKELKQGCKFCEIRDIASKIADNAARLATLFHVFNYGINGVINLKEVDGASRIAEWHLNEAHRLYGELGLPVEQVNAVKLNNWLVEFCKRQNSNFISRRDLQRNITPSCLRNGVKLDSALKVLEECFRVQKVEEGNKKFIYVNPDLL